MARGCSERYRWRRGRGYSTPSYNRYFVRERAVQNYLSRCVIGLDGRIGLEEVEGGGKAYSDTYPLFIDGRMDSIGLIG